MKAHKTHWVTGGCGFIGSHLVDALLEKGDTVYVVDDLSSGDPANLTIQLDDSTSVGRPVKRGNGTLIYRFDDFVSGESTDLLYQIAPDTVFHLAARPRVAYSVEHPAETNDINVQKSVKLLEAVRSLKKTRFVFSSSSSVYGGADVLPTPASHPKNPKSPYALQKSIIEDYCTLFSSLYGIETISLRYFNVFGPRAKGNGAYATAVSAWISAIKEGRPLRSDGDGSQSRDMCHVANVVQANLLAASTPMKLCGQRYNVACDFSVTNKQILDYLRSVCPDIDVIDAPWRPGDVMHTRADISETKRDLSYDPKVDFWSGLTSLVEQELGYLRNK